MQTFSNAALGFNISYPDHWNAVPAAWIKQFVGRAKGTSEKLAEFLASGTPPFFVATDPHVRSGLAVPGIKCIAHPLTVIEAFGGVPKYLSYSSRLMKQAFPDYEERGLDDELVMAGVIGGRLVAAMSVKNPEGASFHGLTELFVLPASDYVFTIALTATSDPAYRPDEQLADIRKSIRLG